MSFDWEGYLDLARRLAATPAAAALPAAEATPSPEATPSAVEKDTAEHAPTEAALRTAVSRAYYAAFHFARSYLEGEGRLLNSKVESHGSVWDAFFQPGKERTIQAKGQTLHKARKMADYESGQPVPTTGWRGSPAPARKTNWQEQAQLAVEQANQIRANLAALQAQKKK